MNVTIKNKLLKIAEKKMAKNDPSHDFSHHLRVFKLAEKITKSEKADPDVVVPAALFHDVVVYAKNDPRSKRAPEESALLIARELKKIRKYPQHKIPQVMIAIEQCSYSKGIIPEMLEARILQDADRLEATGAISIMRTFASSGQMNRPFYHRKDPFAENRSHDALNYSLDLFFTRLLVVGEKMHTKMAKSLAKRRTEFLKKFLKELRLELQGK